MGIFYESGPYGVLVFAFVTILLGGSAAYATGQALASAWLPAWRCFPVAALLAAATAFLHYALFQEPVIPLRVFTEAAAEWQFGALKAAGMGLGALRGWAFMTVVLAGFTCLGYRLRRKRQMIRLYGFAFAPAGPFHWRPKGA